MSVYSVPDMLLEKFVCVRCKNYLSLFPVYRTGSESGGVCGRCKDRKDGFIRDEAYEGMAQFILFPCINKANGCSESLTPLAMETHEPNCKYGRIACFIDNKKCRWRGARSELQQHFAKEHTDSLLKEPKFQLKLLKSSEYKMLLQYDSEHFLIYTEFDIRQGFKCSIEHFKNDESSDCYSYNLEFIAGKLCHKSHEKSTESEENWVKVNTNFFKNHFKNPASVWIHINFKRHYKEELGTQVEDLLNNPSINWDILASLQCPVCFDYVIPPIYQCSQGHPICGTCRPRLDSCPTCRVTIVGQNNALEKIAVTLNYPCKYHINGCTYYDNCKEITKHENACQFK